MTNILTNFMESLVELLNLNSEMMSIAIKIWSLSISLILQLMFVLVGIICICWFVVRVAMLTIRRGEKGYKHVAFFHPYCNAGGGGERVLWCAIRAIQRRYPNVKCYIYTGDIDATPEKILRKAQQRFDIVLPRPVEFIFLNWRTVVEARHYPILTLFMQSLGSVLLGSEALLKFRPDIYFDTMGYAFTYPLFRYIGSCTVGSYTHYPTISTDMFTRVANRIEAHNNRGVIARSVVFSTSKLAYYYIFAMMYRMVGRCAHLVLVNSSWTHRHIQALWGHSCTHIVYPPCDTEKFKSLSLIPDSKKTVKNIISVGQFRPEKDHLLQLKSFKRLCEILHPSLLKNVQLVLIGGCRDEQDQQRVDNLKNIAGELGISGKIVWKLNAPFTELLDYVQTGTIGLHTMWNEHFGICVVECMAGGLIMVAHESGGPQMDIVIDYDGQQTGYRAMDTESYAQAMRNVLEASDNERELIRRAARASVDRFSDDEFKLSFLTACERLFTDNPIL